MALSAGLPSGVDVSLRSVHAQNVQRLMYVSVDDEEGIPVAGLDETNFVVLEDGVEQRILRARRATAPMQIAVLIDTSTAARQVLSEFRSGLATFVENLSAGNQIALYTFGGPRFVLVAATVDADRLRDGIAQLSTRPQTASYLLGALSDTARGFLDRDAPRPVIVTLTTNGVDFSDEEPEELARNLQANGVPMHAVVARTARVRMRFTGTFGLGAIPSWANRGRDHILDAGPRLTGGLRIDLSAQSGISAAMRRMASELMNQYEVVYAAGGALLARQVQVGIVVDEPVSVRVRPARTPAR
jgi:VWFA-related protein